MQVYAVSLNTDLYVRPWLLGKEPWRVLRGCWFEVLGDKWYPVEEKDHCLIEEQHVDRKWRERVRREGMEGGKEGKGGREGGGREGRGMEGGERREGREGREKGVGNGGRGRRSGKNT